MDNQTIFLALIAVFVALSAAAMIFQAAMLYGTYKTSRELRDRIVPLTVKVDALVDTSHKTIDEARVKMGEITSRTNEILDIAKQQMETSNNNKLTLRIVCFSLGIATSGWLTFTVLTPSRLRRVKVFRSYF